MLFTHTKKKNFRNETKTILPNESSDFWFSNIQTSDEEAKKLSAVFACITIKSESLSKIPFKVRDNKTKQELELYNLNYLLNFKPNPKMNAATFKKLIETWVLSKGNAYVLPIRKYRSMNIESLIPIHPGNVNIIKDQGDLFYKISLPNIKEELIVGYEDIIHLKGHVAEDGITGVSPLEYARLTTAVGLNQEEFQRSFYQNDGRPSGVLEVATNLSEKDKKIKKEDGTEEVISFKRIMLNEWNEMYASPKNRFKTALLDNGIKYTTIPQISPADMDFVNSKTVNIADICRFFNMPQYKLGEGKQSYSSNEQASIEYVKTTLVPEVVQWEQEFANKCLTESDIISGKRIQGNLEAELRGDTGARGAWYKDLIQMGAINSNEIREKEDMPAYDGGNRFYVGPNYTPVEFIGKEVKE